MKSSVPQENLGIYIRCLTNKQLMIELAPFIRKQKTPRKIVGIQAFWLKKRTISKPQRAIVEEFLFKIINDFYESEKLDGVNQWSRELVVKDSLGELHVLASDDGVGEYSIEDVYDYDFYDYISSDFYDKHISVRVQGE